MNLSTNSIGWHRTRRWIDHELELLEDLDPYNDYHQGFIWGQAIAYVRMRERFNTPEENSEADRVRREMFG